jgi:hypothetical protein
VVVAWISRDSVTGDQILYLFNEEIPKHFLGDVVCIVGNSTDYIVNCLDSNFGSGTSLLCDLGQLKVSVLPFS